MHLSFSEVFVQMAMMINYCSVPIGFRWCFGYTIQRLQSPFCGGTTLKSPGTSCEVSVGQTSHLSGCQDSFAAPGRGAFATRGRWSLLLFVFSVDDVVACFY